MVINSWFFPFLRSNKAPNFREYCCSFKLIISFIILINSIFTIYSFAPPGSLIPIRILRIPSSWPSFTVSPAASASVASTHTSLIVSPSFPPYTSTWFIWAYRVPKRKTTSRPSLPISSLMFLLLTILVFILISIFRPDRLYLNRWLIYFIL